jgi:hypothetical protein
MTEPPGTSDPALAEVHLIGLPVPVWAKAQEHADELIREFTLIAGQLHDHHRHHPDAVPVPVRLVELVEALTARYGSLSVAQEARLAAAAASGHAEIDDMVFHVPPEAAEAARQLAAMLDEVDNYCRAGQHLLALATPTEQIAFRNWYLGQFIRQIAGHPPTPWTDYPTIGDVGDPRTPPA